MAHGYAGMASFVALQMGLVWVIGCILLFVGAYLIGSKKGGRAAAKYTAVVTLFFLIGFASIVGYAYFTGEAQLFLETYTPAVVIEMMILALGCVWIMWFMATQYSRGRIAIDERFGSKENYLRAKEAAKRASAGGGLVQDMQAAPAMLEPGAQVDTFGQVTEQTVPAGIPGADGTVTPISGAPATGVAASDAHTNAMPAIDPATGLPQQAAPAAAPAIDPATGLPTAAPAAQTAAPAAIDPATGQPAAAPTIDPTTGLPQQAVPAAAPIIDPATGLPQQAAPAAAPAIDPATGLPTAAPAAPAAAPAVDPYTGQPIPAPASAAMPGQPPAPAAPAPAVAQPAAPQAVPAVDPYTGQPIPAPVQAMPQQPEASSSDMVTPLPLGPSAPSVMPDSNEQWLQQLEPAAVTSPGMGDQAAVSSLDPFAPPAPAVDPYTGQPTFAPDQGFGQPGFAAPAPGQAYGQPDPFAQQPGMGMPTQQPGMGMPPAPAVDPYTGQPTFAPGQAYGQAPAPAPDAAFNPYGHPPAHPPQPGYGQAPPPGPYGY